MIAAINSRKRVILLLVAMALLSFALLYANGRATTFYSRPRLNYFRAYRLTHDPSADYFGFYYRARIQGRSLCISRMNGTMGGPFRMAGVIGIRRRDASAIQRNTRDLDLWSLKSDAGQLSIEGVAIRPEVVCLKELVSHTMELGSAPPSSLTILQPALGRLNSVTGSGTGATGHSNGGDKLNFTIDGLDSQSLGSLRSRHNILLIISESPGGLLATPLWP